MSITFFQGGANNFLGWVSPHWLEACFPTVLPTGIYIDLTKTVCLFEMKRQSNTDLIIVPLPNFFLQRIY